MKVNSLKLLNFRNYSELQVNFEGGINLLYGRNASGKTNVVEAISLLSLGKSFRTNEDEYLIKQGEEVAYVGIDFFKRENRKLELAISKKGKTITYNSNKLERLSELSGILISLTFIPEDVLLFKDSPSVRRKFLDISLMALYRRYIKELVEYKNTLKQRNALLKLNEVDLTLLHVFNEKMIQNEYIISKYRNELIQKLEKRTNGLFNLINEKQNEVEIKYQTDMTLGREFEEFKKKALELYKANEEFDLRRRVTNVGIHKDDFIVYLNGKEVGEFASQGQNRLLALSLKLAYGELVKELTNDDPVIILDDVLSELDRVHQDKLLEVLRRYEQVFITSAKEEDIENITKYQVLDGMVIRRN